MTADLNSGTAGNQCIDPRQLHGVLALVVAADHLTAQRLLMFYNHGYFLRQHTELGAGAKRRRLGLSHGATARHLLKETINVVAELRPLNAAVH